MLFRLKCRCYDIKHTCTLWIVIKITFVFDSLGCVHTGVMLILIMNPTKLIFLSACKLKTCRFVENDVNISITSRGGNTLASVALCVGIHRTTVTSTKDQWCKPSTVSLLFTWISPSTRQRFAEHCNRVKWISLRDMPPFIVTITVYFFSRKDKII